MATEAIPLAQSAKCRAFRGPDRCAVSRKEGSYREIPVPFIEPKSGKDKIGQRKRSSVSTTAQRRKKSAQLICSEQTDLLDWRVPNFAEVKSREGCATHYESEVSARFLKFGSDNLLDEDLLGFLLSRTIRDLDVKSLAKRLIAEFGSFAEVIAAQPGRLQKFVALDFNFILQIKIIEAAARRMTKATLEKRPALGNLGAVIEYCRTAMAFLDREQFRVFFLDKKNTLIADEVHGMGTIDHAPVYPREIIRRALELNASAIILAHNHPSGDPEPSTADIYLTHEIIAAAKLISLEVHDHIIIGRHGHISLKNRQMM